MEKCHNVHSLFLLDGLLFHEYAMNAYCVTFESQFCYHGRNQNHFHAEILCGLQDAVSRGDIDALLLSRITILPSSFVGGPRYMVQNYQDSMVLCLVMDILIYSLPTPVTLNGQKFSTSLN